jgi:hypothetical protein
MANTFRPKIEDIPAEEKPLKAKKSKPKKERSTPKPEKSKSQKSLSATGKKIRKGFNAVFGGGILRGINLKKNWPYFLMATAMIIILIYNSLNMQSKKVKIESLKDQIVVANDVLMDVIEEGYTIDDVQDKELSELAKEEGFINKGYIPYIIKEDEE